MTPRDAAGAWMASRRGLASLLPRGAAGLVDERSASSVCSGLTGNMPSPLLRRHHGRLLLALSVAACATSAAPGDTTPIHDWATDPFSPPQSEAPKHVAQMYAGIDHEVLAERAKVKDAEHAATRSAEAARRAAEDKSPEAFLRRVRSFEPGSYELLFKCADSIAAEK